MNSAASLTTDFESQIEFDFLRATESAALNTLQWLGKGQKEKADEAACDAIRGMLDLVDICGEVVIGEGIKDEAPGLFKGEKVGSWKAGSPRFEIALDPVDGTTNASKGMPNSLSCIVAAYSENERPCLQDIPAFDMRKLAYPLAVRRAWMEDQSLPINIDAPIEDVIDVTARILGKQVRDVVISVLDRPRNQHIIEVVRQKGATLRMIMDGDISAAMRQVYTVPKRGSTTGKYKVKDRQVYSVPDSPIIIDEYKDQGRQVYSVPDSGSTAMLLGAAFLAVLLARRRLATR